MRYYIECSNIKEVKQNQRIRRSDNCQINEIEPESPTESGVEKEPLFGQETLEFEILESIAGLDEEVLDSIAGLDEEPLFVQGSDPSDLTESTTVLLTESATESLTESPITPRIKPQNETQLEKQGSSTRDEPESQKESQINSTEILESIAGLDEEPLFVQGSDPIWKRTVYSEIWPFQSLNQSFTDHSITKRIANRVINQTETESLIEEKVLI